MNPLDPRDLEVRPPVIIGEPVTHLPESSAAPWPGLTDYRPPGWDSDLTPDEIGPRLEIVAPGGRPLPGLEEESAKLNFHMGLLRQTWATRFEVWRLAELLVGPPGVDPFWNPRSLVHLYWHGVRLLDGNDGRDGFDVLLWGVDDAGRPRTAYVNGPHSDTSRYVATCTEANTIGHSVAAVVALDGLRWFAGAVSRATGDARAGRCDVMSCDVLAVPESGRMSFLPPPGVKPSSPTKGYGLACWGVPLEVLEGLWPEGRGGAVRLEHEGERWTLLRGAGDAGFDPSHVVSTRTEDTAEKT